MKITRIFKIILAILALLWVWNDIKNDDIIKLEKEKQKQK